MPDNYYDDAEGSHGSPEGKPGGDKEDSSDGQTALIPKSVFAGKELHPGDKCDITVIRVHEDAYEVEGCKEGEDEQEQPQEAPAPSSDESGGDGGGMSSMMD